jgi:hypothetical protein
LLVVEPVDAELYELLTLRRGVVMALFALVALLLVSELTLLADRLADAVERLFSINTARSLRDAELADFCANSEPLPPTTFLRFEVLADLLMVSLSL